MGSRRLSLAAISLPDAATLTRGALATARFLDRRVAMPAIAFLVHSIVSLFNFIEEFADSADEVRKAMARARSERYTISAHRRSQ